MAADRHPGRQVPEPPDVAHTLCGEYLPVLERFVAILASRGVDHGLVGPREVPRLWDRHVLNCVTVGEVIAQGASVADVGTGAGLPGLVLAAARPDLSLHLIEPLQRRVTWLEGAVAELNLSNVTIHRGKAQAVWGEVHVDVVTSRAVARLAELVDWCLPLLVPGGEIVAIKGASARSEVAEDMAKMTAAGATSVDVEVLGGELLEVPTTVVRVRGSSRRPIRRATAGAQTTDGPTTGGRPARQSSKGRRRTAGPGSGARQRHS